MQFYVLQSENYQKLFVAIPNTQKLKSSFTSFINRRNILHTKIHNICNHIKSLDFVDFGLLKPSTQVAIYTDQPSF